MNAIPDPAVIVSESGNGPYAQFVTAGRHVMGADEPESFGGRASSALCPDACDPRARNRRLRLARAMSYLEAIQGYQEGALRVYGMLAEFSGLLGLKDKFDQYAEQSAELMEAKKTYYTKFQLQQAEAAVDRGRLALSKPR